MKLGHPWVDPQRTCGTDRIWNSQVIPVWDKGRAHQNNEPWLQVARQSALPFHIWSYIGRENISENHWETKDKKQVKEMEH